MGAIYNAKFIGSPVLIAAGQQEQGHGLMEPVLYGPLVQMAEPLVKIGRASCRERVCNDV